MTAFDNNESVHVLDEKHEKPSADDGTQNKFFEIARQVVFEVVRRPAKNDK